MTRADRFMGERHSHPNTSKGQSCRFRILFLPLAALLFGGSAPVAGQDFGSASSVISYSHTRGSGISSGSPKLVGHALQGDAPFVYTADVPREGNYRVTLVLGGSQPSRTTVRAELRRLMLNQVAVPAGGARTMQFIVNVRTPDLPGGGQVRIRDPRETIQEAVAWDRSITLEFDGERPAVRKVAIDPVRLPTIYLLGDSTVTDQPAEPYTSWGQMITAFFRPTIAIANHSESGESLLSAIDRGRVEKIMSLLQPGDTLMVQLGHNDQKEVAHNPNAPQRFKAQLTDVVTQAREKGATVVLVTPVSRNSFENGRIVNSFGVYPDMTRAVAHETGVYLIDLNRMSARLYEALGPTKTLALFKHNPDGTGQDRTHHSSYGAWEIAKTVALGMREQHVPAAKNLVEGFTFNVRHPDPLSKFTVPSSLSFTRERPWGS